jgi:hypothetical protein
MGRGQALLTGGRGVGTLSVCQGLSNFIAFIDLNRDQASPHFGRTLDLLRFDES